MHGRLPRGKSALDRELAIVLVGLGVWLDIDSKRAGYTGGVCTLEEFLIFHRCWFCVLSNIWWFRIIEGSHTFQQDWVDLDSTRLGELKIGHFVDSLFFIIQYIQYPNGCISTRGCLNPWMFPPWRFYHVKKSLVLILPISIFYILFMYVIICPIYGGSASLRDFILSNRVGQAQTSLGWVS